MLISVKIKEMKYKFDGIADMLYKGDGTGIVSVKNLLTDAISLINVFIGIIPVLAKMGIDVPREVLDSQIENLKNGLEHKDYFLIADSLKYEINDTLTVIGDLVAEGVIKDEELF
ncbi:MAG: hypothetical protein J6L69_04815 [Lachnospiraceae bacterium]|nr:hypothetical protein [Lachnospiraceae bacterium]